MNNGIDSKYWWKGTIINGEIKISEYKFPDSNIILIPKIKDVKKVVLKKRGHKKESYIRKWVRTEIKIGGLFSRDAFFKAYPKHNVCERSRQRVEDSLKSMKDEGMIEEYGEYKFERMK